MERLKRLLRGDVSERTSRMMKVVAVVVLLLMLFILGVTSIREFTFPLMCGIICGAYSSVCLAGTLWYIMKRGKK